MSDTMPAAKCAARWRANRPLGAASYPILPTAPTYETQAMLSLPLAAWFVAVGALFFICLKKKRT